MRTPPLLVTDDKTGLAMLQFADGSRRPAEGEYDPYRGARLVAASQALGVTIRQMRTRRRRAVETMATRLTLLSTDHGQIVRRSVLQSLLAAPTNAEYFACARRARPSERDLADKLIVLRSAAAGEAEERARRAAGPPVRVLRSR